MSVKLLSAHGGLEEQYISETLLNGFFTVDRNWMVMYWNKAAEKLLGVPARDIVNKNIWEELVDIIPLDFYMVYDKAFVDRNPVQFQEFWGEIGTWFDVVCFYCNKTLSVSFKGSSLPPRPEDMHSPQHPEQQLKILNKLYRLVTEASNDCLYEWDLASQEIFWIDGGHKRIFGYNIENILIPQSFWESRIHPDDRVRVLKRFNKIIKDSSEKEWEEEYRFQKASGEYVFVRDHGNIVFDANGVAVKMVGATQDISKQKLLQDQLANDVISKRRELTEAVLTALENDRVEIGRELHDNMGQLLAMAKLYIEMSRKPSLRKEAYLDQSLDFISDVIDQIRKISKTLIMPSMHIIGLFDNIKNLLRDLSKIHTVKIKFHTEGITEEEIGEKLQLNIFRVIQEQINNIIKHSEATIATISITRSENTIILLISDDGKGYDFSGVDNEKGNGGVGLINIRSRAELFYGSVELVSEPGKGYHLKVLFSLPEDHLQIIINEIQAPGI